MSTRAEVLTKLAEIESRLRGELAAEFGPDLDDCLQGRTAADIERFRLVITEARFRYLDNVMAAQKVLVSEDTYQVFSLGYNLSAEVIPLPPPRCKVRGCIGCGSRFRPLRPEHDLCRKRWGNHRARQYLDAFRAWYRP